MDPLAVEVCCLDRNCQPVPSPSHAGYQALTSVALAAWYYPTMQSAAFARSATSVPARPAAGIILFMHFCRYVRQPGQ